MTTPRLAVLPRGAFLEDAVREGGGEVVDVADAEGVVWSDPKDAGGLRRILDEHPGIRWVQLPWAGIEPFVDVLDDDHVWTCGKGVYAEPVAEHALALALAGMRAIGHYARQRTWTGPVGRNLLGATVTILGGGEITTSLVRLLGPFGCTVRVVRRHVAAMDGVDEVVPSDDLHRLLPDTDLLVLALALTDETAGIIGADELALLPDHAWIVNVARGQHVDTDALVAALEDGAIGGAALDVTDPEPLPDDHPLWEREDVIISPHTANTPEMGRPLLARRVTDNVRRWAAGEELLGPVHTDLGY
ncbi:MAG: D-isomer specific 2-hydroxyacid dehydrogenase family protein [Actinobacteria bacterium]|nr:D-isomer specific 2-hydroxyacid dehydrogenase family protein [Actinomycetota bacterium]